MRGTEENAGGVAGFSSVRRAMPCRDVLRARVRRGGREPPAQTGSGFETSGARRGPATGAAQRTPLARTRRTCGWK